MSLSLQSPLSPVTLATHADWDEWLIVIQVLAQSKGVWDLVDPSLQQEPALLRRPTRPTASSVNADAESIAALDVEGREVLRLLISQYNDEQAAYREQNAAFESITTHITKTIARQNVTFITGCTTPYTILRALRKRLAPTDEARKVEVLMQYKALQDNNPQNVERWLQDWEKVYTDAKALLIFEVQEDKPLEDFLVAVERLHPFFAQVQQIKMEDLQAEGKKLPSLFDQIERFRNTYRLRNARVKAGRHTAFAATLQGQSDSSPPPPRKCLCGETSHWSNACPYFVWECQTKGWTPDPKVEAHIKEILAEKPKVRDGVRKYTNTGIVDGPCSTTKRVLEF